MYVAKIVYILTVCINIILLSFLPLNQRTVLHIYVFDHTGLQTLSNVFANAHSIAQTDINCPQLRTREIMTPPAYVRLWRSENEG